MTLKLIRQNSMSIYGHEPKIYSSQPYLYFGILVLYFVGAYIIIEQRISSRSKDTREETDRKSCIKKTYGSARDSGVAQASAEVTVDVSKNVSYIPDEQGLGHIKCYQTSVNGF